MKFVIRRAIVSVVAVPLVAVAWVAVNALLIAYGAGASNTAQDTFVMGLWLGGVAGVAFTFAPQLKTWLG